MSEIREMLEHLLLEVLLYFGNENNTCNHLRYTNTCGKIKCNDNI